MQTNIATEIIATPQGQRAESILRSCVHCGFCNATCPTYQLTGNELDGPRGRIFLINEMLSTGEPNPVVVKHLDRCLTCRACETTCPSGVAYGELLEIGRNFFEPKIKRALFRRWLRTAIRRNVANAERVGFLLRVGRLFRWFLPTRIRKMIKRSGKEHFAQPVHSSRRVIVLRGCSARYLTPDTTSALTKLLTLNDIEYQLVDSESCCGALDLHLGEQTAALKTIAKSLDALAPLLDGVEAILSSASGCGVTIKDYGRLLSGNEAYEGVAARVAELTQDASEFLSHIAPMRVGEKRNARIAWQAPCTLQHGQKIIDQVPELLRNAGYELTEVAQAGTCCGSAGTYSILEKEMATQLKVNKLDNLMRDQPDIIATANVGCQTHLMTEATIPVVHYLELLA